MEHLVILSLLSIFFPLIFIPFFILLKRGKTYFYVLQTCLHLGLLFSLYLVLQQVGGFELSFAVFHFSFRLDLFVFAFAIMFSNFLIMFYNIGHGYVSSALYDSFLCLLLSSLFGSVFASDLLTIFIFLDLTLFSAGYLIFSIREAVKAAYKYVFLNILASIFLLGGIFLYSSYLGTYEILPLPSDFGIVSFFLLLGLFIKAGVFPFHLWVPDAYSKSPIPVACLLSGGAGAITLLSIYKLLPLILFPEVLRFFGMITALFASLIAIDPRLNLRKTFSYFCIAETGFVIYALGLNSSMAIFGAFILVLTQTFAKSLLFSFAGLITEEHGVLPRHYSWALFGLLVGGFSVSGLPITGGFVGKFAIISAAYQTGSILGLVLFPLSSFFLVLALLKVYERFSQLKRIRKAHYTTLLSILMFSLINIIIGLSFIGLL
ncbi:MAG: hypothetical protein DRP12_00340 [Candidatus Aenigmatarchaeota archaeon]|nr:MAG: hypothetical protein DRP12_00340 [Candidatus Aenigmarchaeota archaeon]